MPTLILDASWGQGPLWRQWLGTTHTAGLEPKSWDKSQVSLGPWAPLRLMWGHLLMGALSISLRPQPTLCLNHCWRTNSQEDWRKPSWQRMVTIPASGRVHPEETRIRNSKKRNPYFQDYIYMYICSTNRIYIYIYIKISTEHLKFGYNLDPKNDFFFWWLCCMACGILFPWIRMESPSPALEAQRLNHWTEVPKKRFFWIAESRSHTDLHSEAIKQ